MGNPVLRTKARTLDRQEIRSPVVQQLIDDMLDTMAEYRGVGLAAPQVHHGLRLFVATLDDEDREGGRHDDLRRHQPRDHACRHRHGRRLGRLFEHPGHPRPGAARAREIKLRAYDRKGDRIELRAHDFAARVIQHETDHLDGVLFFDRMRSFGSLTFLDEYSRFWRKDKDDR